VAVVVLKGRVMVVVEVVGCDGPGRFEWRPGYVWTCISQWNTLTPVDAAELIQLLGPGLGDFICKNRVNIFQIREMFASTELLE